MKMEESNIPETLEEKRLYSLELLEKLEETEGVHNRLSLCWELARRDHFNGNGKRFSEWARTLDPDLCSSLLSQRLAVGSMLEDFRRRDEAVFSVLMALPFRKNVVLAYIPTPALRDEFLSKYDLPSLKKISREKLAAGRDAFLNHAPETRKTKAEAFFQPDLFGWIEKAASAKTPEALDRIAGKIDRKRRGAELLAATGQAIRLLNRIRETPERDAVEELEKEIARLTVRLDEWKRTASETPEHEAEEKTAALPAVTGKHAVAVHEAKEPKKPEQLSDKDKALMTERLAFCQTVWKYKDGGETDRNAVALADRELVDRLPLLRTSGKLGRSALNVQNYRLWLRLLGKNEAGEVDWSNHLALAPRHSGRRAEAPRGPEEFWRIFFGLYDHRNKLPLPVAYRNAVERFRTDYPESGEALPDENHVRYIASRRVPKGLHILKREGESAWMNKVGYKISRNWDVVRPNECWFGDHRIHDIFLKTYDEKGRAVARRPWITMFTDAKSWYVVGYRIGFEGINSEFIINTFAQAVHEHGEPESLYFDNGGDFQKRGFTTPVQFKPDGPAFCILNSLNIRLRTALPYRGRAKTIERVFRYASDRLDRMFLSYLGNRPGERPENAGMYSKEENAENLPSLDEFCRFFERFLNDYHNRPNNGKILKGLTPEQAYDRQRMAVRAVRSEEEYKLAFLLPDPTLRKVRDGARVEVDHKSYFNPALYDCFGSSVMVKLDLQDRESVYVYTPEGRFLCRASTQPDVPALADSEEERKLLAAAMKLQGGGVKAARQAIKAATGGQLDKFTASELEAMTPEQRRSLAEGSARLETAGEYRSVQGEHRHKRYRLKGTEISGANVSGRIDPEGEEEESEAERLRRLDLLTAMYE